MPLPPKPLAFVGLVGIWPSGLAAAPRQWIEPKISRKSPNAARRFYRGVDRSSSKIPRWHTDSVGCAPRGFWRRTPSPTGAATSLRATERATQFGSVAPACISESRSPCREYVDRFKTSEERLRERSGRDGSEWPCTSTHRCNGGHRARSTADPGVTRTKTELGSNRRSAGQTRRHSRQ